MKKVFGASVLFLVLIFSGCSISNNNKIKIDNEGAKNQVSDPQQQVKNQNTNSSTPSIDNSEVSSCDFWKDKDYQESNSNNSMVSVKDKAGSLIVQGQILQRIEDASFEEDKKVTKAYLVFYNPVNEAQQLFYNYYSANVANGNGINRVDDQKLLFRLGIIKDSKLITTANISDELKNRIVSLIDTDNTIQLKLIIPIYNGGGVGDDFSFACDISE
jgi:hypothetical protein